MRRLVLTPRWIMWHVLTLGAMVTCGLLAAWQWHRAGSAMGSALNVGYGLQWPVFAVFFGVMWWRMLRMEAARLAELSGEGAAADAPPEPETETAVDAAVPAPRPDVEPALAGAPARSPFGPRPVGVTPLAVEEGSELAAYNRMLAELAARTTED